jgi:hypothetical protein
VGHRGAQAAIKPTAKIAYFAGCTAFRGARHCPVRREVADAAGVEFTTLGKDDVLRHPDAGGG